MYIDLSYETYVTCDDDIVLTPGRLKSNIFSSMIKFWYIVIIE